MNTCRIHFLPVFVVWSYPWFAESRRALIAFQSSWSVVSWIRGHRVEPGSKSQEIIAVSVIFGWLSITDFDRWYTNSCIWHDNYHHLIPMTQQLLLIHSDDLLARPCDIVAISCERLSSSSIISILYIYIWYRYQYFVIRAGGLITHPCDIGILLLGSPHNLIALLNAYDVGIVAISYRWLRYIGIM